MSPPAFVFPALDRKETDVLMKGFGDGHYLLRLRSADTNDEFILGVQFRGKPTHHLLKKNEAGKWCLNKNTVIAEATTVEDVCRILGEPRKGWPVVLKTRKEYAAAAAEPAAAAPAPVAPTEAAPADDKAELRRREEERLAELKRKEEAELAADEAAAAAAAAAERAGQQARERELREQEKAKQAAAEKERQQAAAAAAAAKAQQAAAAAAAEATSAAPAASGAGDARLSKAEAALEAAKASVRRASVPVPSADGGESSTAPADPNKPAWLWMDCSKEKAQELLTGKPDGTFLARARADSGDQFIISLVFRGKPSNHLAAKKADGTWTMNKKDFGGAKSLTALITTLGSDPLPAGWPVRLHTPVVDPSAATASAGASSGGMAVDQAALSAAQATLAAAEAEVKAAKDAAAASDAAAAASAAAAAEAAAAAAAASAAEAERQVQDKQNSLRAAEQEAARIADVRVQVAKPAKQIQVAEAPMMRVPPTTGSGKFRGRADSRLTRGKNDDFWDNGDQDGQSKLEDGALTVIIAGRKGFADFINGHYEAQVGMFHDERPTYKHTYTITSGYGSRATGKEVHLYYHRKKTAWVLSQSLGSKNDVIAYAPGDVPRPEMISNSWKVSDKAGSLQVDTFVRCVPADQKISAFRRSLQSSQQANFFKQELSEEQITDICDELSSPTSQLTSLKLYYNKLRTKDIRALAEALVANASLTHLQIRDNNLDDEGAKLLATMMEKNSTLQMVSLRENSVSNSGATSLAEGLRRNSTLVGLSLRDNVIEDDGVENLILALKINKTLRGLALYGNKVKKGKKLKAMLDKSSQCSIELKPPQL